MTQSIEWQGTMCRVRQVTQIPQHMMYIQQVPVRSHYMNFPLKNQSGYSS